MISSLDLRYFNEFFTYSFEIKYLNTCNHTYYYNINFSNIISRIIKFTLKL